MPTARIYSDRRSNFVLCAFRMDPVSLPTHLLIAHWSLTNPLIFSLRAFWSPRLKLKISRYNPSLTAVGSSVCILLSSLTPHTVFAAHSNFYLCTVLYFVFSYTGYIFFFFSSVRLICHLTLKKKKKVWLEEFMTCCRWPKVFSCAEFVMGRLK